MILSAIELFKINKEGRFGDKDDKLAFEYLNNYRDKIDLDTNDTGEANYLLADCYMNGIGTEQNINEAIFNYMISCAKGYVTSGIELGKYFSSKGDKINAIRFLLISDPKENNDSANKLLNDLIK